MHTGALIAGRYRLQDPVGSGSMGQVWLARDDRLQRDVAVKVVDLAHATGPVTAERFHREVIAMARTSHPNIVTTFDGGVDGTVAYVVMEFLRGQSLADRLARGPLTIPDATRICADVARALEASHRIGVVHRDIKPGNVFLCADGTVKVLDFGIAELTGDTTAPPADAVVGTAAYMAPEHAQGHRAGPESDVYALGCLTFAMLAGRPPFAGATAVDVAQQQIRSAPPRVTDLRPDAPAPLARLVAAMLAKDPGHRPTAADLVVALVSRGRPVVGRDADATVPLVPGPPAGTPPVPTGTAVLPTDTAVLPPPTPSRDAAGPAPVVPGPAPGPTDAQRTAVLPGPIPAGQRRPPVQTTPHPPGPIPPRRRPNDSWFRRAARTVLVAVGALLAVAAIAFVGTQLLGLLPNSGTALPRPTASTTMKKPTAAKPATTMPGPMMPSVNLPTISLPTIALPTVPSARQAALLAAVEGVTVTLDSWRPADAAATDAKAQLQADWATASERILSGSGARPALDAFSAEAKALRKAGAVPMATYAALTVALKAVDALV